MNGQERTKEASEQQNVAENGENERVGEEDDDLPESCCYRIVIEGPCGGCISRWPRCCSLFFGVLIPLFMLIVFSLLFGILLAHVEYPNEVNQNNALLAGRADAVTFSELGTALTSLIPKLCFELYLNNVTLSETEDVGDKIWEIILSENRTFLNDTIQDAVLGGKLITVNATTLYEFMVECGNATSSVVEGVQERIQNATESSSDDLTFNWIRCFPGAESGKLQMLTIVSSDLIRPEAQEEYFSEVWQVSWIHEGRIALQDNDAKLTGPCLANVTE